LSNFWVHDLSPNSSLPNQVRLLQVCQPYKFGNRTSSPTTNYELIELQTSS